MNSYEFQLVLQFAATDISDFDTLVAFEERLIQHLRPSATVDGHDFGCGEFNIFILTNDPVSSFERSEEVRRSELPDYVPVVAYRELSGEDYTVLSPPGDTEFRIS